MSGLSLGPRSHASLQHTERVFDRLPTLAHRFRVSIKALLDGLEPVLMLPPCSPPLWPSCALRFERAISTRCSPVARNFLPSSSFVSDTATAPQPDSDRRLAPANTQISSYLSLSKCNTAAPPRETP